MKSDAKKKPYKRIALALSLCVVIVWGILGTGASLAWFADTSPELNNIFHFADFEVEVSHLKNGNWETIESHTDIFDDDALYEPGYVQVVYLRVKNKGTVPFRFKTAVNVNGYIPATNVFGLPLNLQDYLKFGLAPVTEEDINSGVISREKAKEIATSDLNNYYNVNNNQEKTELGAGQEVFIALVVRMPEEVDNFANYRGETQPKVELGIIVTAEQITD